MNEPRTLSEFVSLSFRQLNELLKPKEEIKRSIAVVVDKVSSHLRSTLSPLKIVKGGSYGKGTNLSNRKEVDLVVIFQDYVPNENNCTQKIRELTESVKKIISITKETNYYEQKNESGELVIRIRSINIILDGIKVDILPGCVLHQGAKSFAQFDTKTQLPYASASASEMQVKFIKNQDGQYKDLVRICKSWRNLEWNWPDGCRPSSYLLELLVLHTYETMNKQIPFSLESGFRKFLQLVEQIPLHIWWQRYYELDCENPLLKSKRVILDPANPTNNVAWCITDWKPLINNAKETLQAMNNPSSYQIVSLINGTNEKVKALAIEQNNLKNEIANIKEMVTNVINEVKLNLTTLIGNSPGKISWKFEKNNLNSPRFFANAIRCYFTFYYEKNEWRLQLKQETNLPQKRIDISIGNNYYRKLSTTTGSAVTTWNWDRSLDNGQIICMEVTLSN